MQKYVLVADDAPTIRMLLKLTLTRAGYQVIEAENGQEAITQMAKEPHPDLVVTDLHMPEMDGITLVRGIRKAECCRFTPIIVFTNPVEPERLEEVRKAGATAWINKPFQPGDLLRMVERFLGPATP